MSVSLELLTDEAILDYTTKDGIDMVVKNHYDVNLKKRTTPIEPVQGGLYDTTIFGSPFIDRCTCGHLKHPGPEPCPDCGARVFTREESLRRFARIEFPFYYLNILRYDAFLTLFNSIFSGSKISFNFKNNDFCAFKFGTKSGKPYIKCFDMCQFDYDPKKKELIISEFITDESKASYEGLLAIVEKHFKSSAAALKKFLNRYYIIQPAAMRPVTLGYRGGKRSMCIPKLTSWYKTLIYFTVAEDTEANSVNYNDVMSQLKSPGERVRYRGLLKAFINSGRKLATRLLNSSKENLAREIYSVNADNSARCPIVPDPDLAIDEVTVPVQIAYEMCREGFIKYLETELNFSHEDAKNTVKLEWNNPETQKMFREFAEKQYVLVYTLPVHNFVNCWK